MQRIKNSDFESAEDEIKKISSVLYSIKDAHVFRVPEKYFENIGDKITDKLNGRKAKVIPISSGGKWWKYAAAAVVAGGITIGSLQIFHHESAADNGNQVLTASAIIPDYIKSSLQYKTPEELENGIASLSVDEIASYLETHGNIIDDGTLEKGIDTTGLPDTEDYLMNDNTLNNFINSIDSKSSDTNTP